ncbi:MAG: hypothetical protein K2H86_06170 [Muribaculaceae bacterium]|nr:hypothetical protein [Muribaculaceae bacterium]
MRQINHSYSPIVWLCGILCSFALLSSVSCSKEKPSVIPDDALILIGDSVLTRTDIVTRIPRGLLPGDSAAMFSLLVNNWVEGMILTKIAEENIDDMERIESMVRDYRNRLIIDSYRRKLRETSPVDVHNDTLRNYYKRHIDEFVLERPVIKGLFIKLPDDATRLSDIRRWMVTATPDAIDNLDKYGLDESVKYSFFKDKWMDWYAIRQQIPYRFDDDDEFVRNNTFFETSYAGMTYLLHISEYIVSGERMPYEVAVPLIRENLEMGMSADFQRKMMRQLYNNAIKSGQMKILDKDNVKL